MSSGKAHWRLWLSYLVFTITTSFVVKSCTPPPEGLWITDNYEPRIRFKEPVNGYIHLWKNPKLPSIYTGRCIFFADIVGPRTSILFFLHAMFDERECKMFGNIVAPATGGWDEDQWTFNGKDEMRGSSIVKVGSSFLFPFHSMKIIKFSGPLETRLNILPLLNDLGQSHLNKSSQSSTEDRLVE